MTNLQEDSGTVEEPEAIAKEAPEEATCPVCERVVPTPLPTLCPHCGAPIETITELLRTADLSLEEAMRDLKVGDLDSMARRLEFVKVTSKRHRLKAELAHTMLLRLQGDPAAALSRLQASRDLMGDEDEELAPLMREIEEQCLEDQTALASCCELYNFALFQARRGYYEEARKALHKALKHVPHHAPSHALLGKVQLALQETDDARYHLERALALDPSNPTATRYLARLGRPMIPNPFARLLRGWRISPRWAGSIIVLVILACLALTALLSR